MKYRLFLIIATAACLGSFTACSQDNDIVVPDGDLKAAISFNVNIGQTPDPQVSMRGASTDATATGGYTFQGDELMAISVIGVANSSRSTSVAEVKNYRVAAGNGGSTAGSARTLTYTGAATDAFQWLSLTEQIKIKAWSFGTKTSPGTTVPTTFNIETTQTGDYVKELLYSPEASKSYTSNAINIPLYHQLARVVVNVTNTESDKYQNDGFTVSSVVIGSTTNEIPTSATFSEPASGNYGTWSIQGTPVTGTVTAKAETTLGDPGTNKATYSAVIIPYDGSQNGSGSYYKAGHKFITITTSRGIYTFTIPSKDSSDNIIYGYNIEPGKQYTFNITNLNEIKLNVTVTAWDTSESARSLTLE